MGILDAHYLHRDPELARAAIHKLELGYTKRLAGTKPEQSPQNDPQNALSGPNKILPKAQ